MALVESGRITFRQEGKWWIASWARADSMNDATEIGRIRLLLVKEDAALKESFMAVIKAAFIVACKGALGIEPEFPDGPKPAPEHERSGNA